MMITWEKATQKSITCSRLSVHQESFLWALCQELVLSTTQRFVAPSGVGLPFWAISARYAHRCWAGAMRTSENAQQAKF